MAGPSKKMRMSDEVLYEVLQENCFNQVSRYLE
jgi:hypothetical protein